jgi:uncharacterized protein (TIGR03083 family)
MATQRGDARARALLLRLVEYDAYVATIRTDTERFAAAAEESGLSATVPTCPDWTLDNLTKHVGNVQRFWTDLVRRRSVEPPDFSTRDRSAPAGDERFEWVRAGGHGLADALAETPETVPVWAFTGVGTVRFWARRQAHEITIHRCDAELTGGALGSIDPDLAADGVNEYFELLAVLPTAPAMRGAGETIHFHCTDRDVEWLAELTDHGLELRAEHAKGDVAVRGPANAVMLAVWNRIDADNPELEIFGDRALLEKWRRLTSF